MTTLPTKALSIRQPWAWAILHAGKNIENRPRRFHYRGPICLHASLHNSAGANIMAGVDICRILDQAVSIPCSYEIDRGGIIGTAEIIDCVEDSDSPWFFGPYGLVLANVQPVPFIPVKGALGLFDWRKQLEKDQ